MILLGGMNLSFTSEENTDIEIDSELVLPIPRKTTDKIYCPKCSAAIRVTMRTYGTAQGFLCGKCLVRVSEYWDSYQKGHFTIARCNECQEPTFAECRYCINCGKISNVKAIDSYSSSIKRGRKLGKNMPPAAKQASYFLFGVGIVASTIISIFEIINPNLESYVFYLIIGVGGFSVIAGFGLLLFFSNMKYETSVKVKRKKFSFLLIFTFGISAFLGGIIWLIGYLLERFLGRICG